MAKDLVFKLRFEVQEEIYVLMQMSCGRNPRRSIEKCSGGFYKEDQYFLKYHAQRRFGEVRCSRENSYCR